MTEPAIISLQSKALGLIAREREEVLKRHGAIREQASRLEELLDAAHRELAQTVLLVRSMDEMLGISDQLPIDLLDTELRGRRLAEVAIQILKARRGPAAEIHYTDWFDLLRHEGAKIGGRDPLATFLAQISRALEIVSVKPCFGTYRVA